MSSVFTTTFTFLVKAGRLTRSLSATAEPLTVNSERLVFELNGATTTRTVNVLTVTRSGAVTVTVTSLFPTTSPVLPVTFTVAARSRVTATTETEVLRGARLTVAPGSTSTPLNVSEVSAVSAEAPPTRIVKT